MNFANTRIYATVEIRHDVLIFCVTKMVQEKMMLIFKREVKAATTWLNDSGEILNVQVAGRILRSLIDEYEKTHNGFKILKISLILPPNKLKIQEKYQEIEINSSVEGAPSLIGDAQLSELKKRIKNEDLTPSYVVLDYKPIAWKVDDQVVKQTDLRYVKGHRVGLTAMVYQIPAKIYASHEQVINLAGCHTMLITISMFELYGLIKNEAQLSPATLITNWNENDLEVGYFEKGILKNFKVIKGGMKTVINNFARKLKLKPATAEDYIFNLIDFSSNHNLNSEIYQKWDPQQKILRKYTGLELTKVLFFEVQKLYQQVNQVARYSETKYETENYNFGLIQAIPGSEKLFQNGDHFNHEHVYEGQIFGTRLSYLYNSVIGVSQTLEKINHSSSRHSIYTSIGTFARQPVEKNNQFPSLDQKMPWMGKPLFLNHEGILVDYQKTKSEKESRRDQ